MTTWHDCCHNDNFNTVAILVLFIRCQSIVILTASNTTSPMGLNTDTQGYLLFKIQDKGKTLIPEGNCFSISIRCKRGTDKVSLFHTTGITMVRYTFFHLVQIFLCMLHTLLYSSLCTVLWFVLFFFLVSYHQRMPSCFNV